MLPAPVTAVISVDIRDLCIECISLRSGRSNAQILAIHVLRGAGISSSESTCTWHDSGKNLHDITHFTKPEKWFCCFAASTVLDLTRARNDDPGTSGSRLGADAFDRFDDIHALNNRTKDNMLTIEPSSIRSAQEELTAIGSRASICLYAGEKITIFITLQWENWKEKPNRNSAPVFRTLESYHAQDSGASVLQLEVFIFKTRAIDGLSTSPVVVGEIPPLAHTTNYWKRDRTQSISNELMKVSEENR